ncbi:MAG: right-handed parallel beta-helix repeat-containing protein [bacterium]
MQKTIGYFLMATLVLFAGGFLTNGNAQPNLIPPVVHGPDTLVGTGNIEVFEFFTQTDTLWKGDIGGIAAGDSYWVYIVGIDASGLTGPNGQQIQFNLQDAADNSTFKHLGISFSLSNPDAGGGGLLECYQSLGNEGLSTQGLAPGILTADKFDLRFKFKKTIQDTGWTVTPYYRLSGGDWIVFFDGTFTASIAFDFLGAKLIVRFDNPIGAPAQGTLTFDNYFVLGPLNQPITKTFVDDDWSNLELGDAVQFPGQDSSIQVFGVNAFASIQEGLNGAFEVQNLSVKSDYRLASETSVIDTVWVAAGTYNENIIIDKCVTLIGAGNGENPLLNTVINSQTDDFPVILIDGINGGGTSPTDRLSIRDLRVQGANAASGSPDVSSGILITNGPIPSVNFAKNVIGTAPVPNTAPGDSTGFITFENVTATNNSGCGITMQHSGVVHDIEVINCTLSNNQDSGIRIPSTLSAFDSLFVTDGSVDENGVGGIIVNFLNINPNNILAQTNDQESSKNTIIQGPSYNNIHVNGTTFSGNGTSIMMALGSGDIGLYDFNGDASFTNVSITGDTSQYGILLEGQVTSATSPSGTVTFNNVQIDGVYQTQSVNNNKAARLQQPPIMYVGAGLHIADYSDVTAISFSGVQLDVLPASTEDPAVNLFLYDVDGTMNLGNTTFGGQATEDIRNFAAVDIDATSADFTNSGGDNFAIEDRVVHIIDLEQLSPSNHFEPISGQSPQLNSGAQIGLVTWVADNVYMTKISFFPPDTSASIQRAINAAATSDTLNIGTGTFFDGPQILIDKNLVIAGSGKSNTTFKPTAPTSDVGEGRAWFLVDTLLTVEVQDMTFDAKDSLIYYAFYVKGQGTFSNVCFNEIKYNESGPDYAGSAIYAAGNGPVHVSNSVFTEIGRTGVIYSGSGVNGSVFQKNHYTGKGAGTWLDYTLDIGAGANVQVKNDTISANRGVVSTDSSAGILMATSSGAGTNVTVTQNEISDCINAILVGLDGTDQSFTLIQNNDLHDNDYAVNARSGLFIKVENNQIYNQSVAGVKLDSVTAYDIDNNDIFDNADAVLISKSFGELDNNIIYDNTNNGLTVLDETSTGVTVHNNEFCNNTIYAIENKGSTTIDATLNWWGAADGPDGAGSGSGDSVSVGVDFSSFVTSPLFQDSPCTEPVQCLSDGDVNNDGSLTPGDALCAFQTFLNGGVLATECDVVDFSCEIVAADANCDESVTPGDALAIFQGFLDSTPPAHCFAAVSDNKLAQLSSKIPPFKLVWNQKTMNPATEQDKREKIVVSLALEKPAALHAFGLRLHFPADQLEFLSVERTSLTSNWTQLDAQRIEPGLLVIGGFDAKDRKPNSDTEILNIVFLHKAKSEGDLTIHVTELTDDLANAALEPLTLESANALPTSFQLHQNFPNPFNPETQIQFEIPATQNGKVAVVLAIYNMTGQLVTKLIDEEKSAGVYKIKWDGKNAAGIRVPSGTYFYSIIAGEFKDTKKMLLLK